jgi:hypothetical protein
LPKLYKIKGTEILGEFNSLETLKTIEEDVIEYDNLPPYK